MKTGKNLHLKLDFSNSTTSLGGPFTPVEQTVQTPFEPPQQNPFPMAPQQFPHHRNPNFNISTDSLQSMQDYVPQSIINRSSTLHSVNSNSNFMSNSNSMYDSDGFSFLERSRSSSRSNSFPNALKINTDMTNFQQLPPQPQTIPYQQNPYQPNTPGNGCTPQNGHKLNSGRNALDSPFIAATVPKDDYFHFSSTNTSSDSIDLIRGESTKINLPNQYSLSEKKRDSLKLKRGIR
ncbi:hypothetical protein G210_0742 [Candida maltosa Xu316]|uniref:Uncharacterized protein n=1 Tax=Candida maltosa (strain Xu316) TaxID=1245528 RepID=M3HMJ4_CANMX|nr:hypothetical protein G210_0742 [Candida maltosa Xu316]